MVPKMIYASADGLFTISWNKVESASHYEIHWSDNSNFSYLSGEKTVKASGKDVEEYDFVELFDVGSKYYFSYVLLLITRNFM